MKKLMVLMVALVMVLVIGVATNAIGRTLFTDDFDDGRYLDKWAVVRDDGVSTVSESGTELHIQIDWASTSDCDGFNIDTYETFSGAEITVEAELKMVGKGGTGIILRKDDNNKLLFRIQTDDVPYIQIQSIENGNQTKYNIEDSAPYLGNYNVFKIVKKGNQYEAYINEQKKGDVITNSGIGDSNLTVGLEVFTCEWKSGNADTYFDFVTVTLPPWDSAFKTLFDHPSDLTLLRQYRDEILAKSSRGKIYTNMLYESSEDALDVLLDNPRLMREAKFLIESNLDAVEAVLNGEEGTINNTWAIAAFLTKFAKKSPADLKLLAITVKKQMLRKQQEGEKFLGFWLD